MELEYCHPPSGIAEWAAREPPWVESFELHRRASHESEEALRPSKTETQTNSTAHSLSERFLEQAEKWDRETAHLSSPTQMMRHPSYEAILLMGDAVVPLMIRDLQKNRRPWFGALTYLTGDNPIMRADAGRMDRMIAAWVEWGKAKGRI